MRRWRAEDFWFELATIADPTSGRPIRSHVVRCRKCDAQASLRPHGMSGDQLRKHFSRQGWQIGKTRNAHLCPNCSAPKPKAAQPQPISTDDRALTLDHLNVNGTTYEIPKTFTIHYPADSDQFALDVLNFLFRVFNLLESGEIERAKGLVAGVLVDQFRTGELELQNRQTGETILNADEVQNSLQNIHEEVPSIEATPELEPEPVKDEEAVEEADWWKEIQRSVKEVRG